MAHHRQVEPAKTPATRWKVLDEAGVELARLERVKRTCVLRLSHAFIKGTLTAELRKLTPAQLTTLDHLLAI